MSAANTIGGRLAPPAGFSELTEAAGGPHGPSADSPAATVEVRRVCDDCRGLGQVVDQRLDREVECRACGGDGFTVAQYTADEWFGDLDALAHLWLVGEDRPIPCATWKCRGRRGHAGEHLL